MRQNRWFRKWDKTAAFKWDKTADSENETKQPILRQNRRFRKWKTADFKWDKTADFENETKPPILNETKPPIPKMRQNSRF